MIHRCAAEICGSSKRINQRCHREFNLWGRMWMDWRLVGILNVLQLSIFVFYRWVGQQFPLRRRIYYSCINMKELRDWLLEVKILMVRIKNLKGLVSFQPWYLYGNELLCCFIWRIHLKMNNLMYTCQVVVCLQVEQCSRELLLVWQENRLQE